MCAFGLLRCYIQYTYTCTLTAIVRESERARELNKYTYKAAIIVQVPLLMRYLTPRSFTKLPCVLLPLLLLLFLCFAFAAAADSDCFSKNVDTSPVFAHTQKDRTRLIHRLRARVKVWERQRERKNRIVSNTYVDGWFLFPHLLPLLLLLFIFISSIPIV